MEEEKAFLTVKDIVDMGLCSQAMAYKLFNSGDFPSVRVGKALRVSREDFEKWLKEQKDGGKRK